MTIDPAWVLYGLCALLVAVALSDLVRLRIPNALPVAIVLLFPLWLVACHSASALQNLIVFAATFAVTTLLFARGWIGGGDAKALAATALWFDVAGCGPFLLAVALGGGLLALVLIVLRRLAPAGLADRLSAPALRAKGPIPYGIAIAAGGVLAVVGGHVNPLPPDWYRFMHPSVFW